MPAAPWIAPENAGATALAPAESLPNPWDVVIIGDVTLPGVSTVTATPSKRLDSKQAAGRDGATPTFVGYTPASVEVRVKVWTPSQWTALQNAIARLWPTSQGGKNLGTYNESFEIQHPSLVALRITKVVIQSVSAPSVAERGMVSMTLRCLEYVPPTNKDATKTVTKAVSASQNNAQVRPEFVLAPVGGGTVLARSENAAQPLPSTDIDFLGPLF